MSDIFQTLLRVEGDCLTVSHRGGEGVFAFQTCLLAIPHIVSISASSKNLKSGLFSCIIVSTSTGR
jgi:hypothetical protein